MTTLPTAELDQLLLRLRNVSRTLSRHRLDRDEAVAAMDERFGALMRPLTEEADALEAQIATLLCNVDPSALKTAFLSHGSIEVRRCPAHVEVADEHLAIDVAERVYNHVVVVTRHLDLNAVRRLPPAVLVELGVELVTEDQITVRLKQGESFSFRRRTP